MSTNYNRVNWENLPSTETPLDERNLNNMEDGIEAVDNDLQTYKTSNDTALVDLSNSVDTRFDQVDASINVVNNKVRYTEYTALSQIGLTDSDVTSLDVISNAMPNYSILILNITGLTLSWVTLLPPIGSNNATVTFRRHSSSARVDVHCVRVSSSSSIGAADLWYTRIYQNTVYAWRTIYNNEIAYTKAEIDNKVRTTFYTNISQLGLVDADITSLNVITNAMANNSIANLSVTTDLSWLSLMPYSTGAWNLRITRGIRADYLTYEAYRVSGTGDIAARYFLVAQGNTVNAWRQYYDNTNAYNKSEVDALIQEAQSGIFPQDPVATYSDLATTYPNPNTGYLVFVEDEGTQYYYDGSEWIVYNRLQTDVVTSGRNGLMLATDKVKLDSLDATAINNVTSTYANSVIIYVDNTYAGTTEAGTQNQPYKTVGAALASVNSNAVIQLSPTTFSEQITISAANYNVEIVGTGAIGQRITTFTGDVVISSISGSLGFSHIYCSGNMSIQATSGELLVDNCHFDYFTTGNASGLTMLMDFCDFTYDIQLQGAPTLTFRTCDFGAGILGGTAYILGAGSQITFDGCYNLALQHNNGQVIVTGNTRFKLLTSTASIYSNATGSSNPLILLSGSTLQESGTYGAIQQTAAGGYYLLAGFLHNPSIDTFAGTRINGGLHAEDIYTVNTPTNIAPVDNRVSSWLSALDQKFDDTSAGLPWTFYTTLPQLGLSNADVVAAGSLSAIVEAMPNYSISTVTVDASSTWNSLVPYSTGLLTIKRYITSRVYLFFESSANSVSGSNVNYSKWHCLYRSDGGAGFTNKISAWQRLVNDTDVSGGTEIPWTFYTALSDIGLTDTDVSTANSIGVIIEAMGNYSNLDIGLANGTTWSTLLPLIGGSIAGRLRISRANGSNRTTINWNTSTDTTGNIAEYYTIYRPTAAGNTGFDSMGIADWQRIMTDKDVDLPDVNNPLITLMQASWVSDTSIGGYRYDYNVTSLGLRLDNNVATEFNFGPTGFNVTSENAYNSALEECQKIKYKYALNDTTIRFVAFEQPTMNLYMNLYNQGVTKVVQSSGGAENMSRDIEWNDAVARDMNNYNDMVIGNGRYTYYKYNNVAISNAPPIINPTATNTNALIETFTTRLTETSLTYQLQRYSYAITAVDLPLVFTRNVQWNTSGVPTASPWQLVSNSMALSTTVAAATGWTSLNDIKLAGTYSVQAGPSFTDLPEGTNGFLLVIPYENRLTQPQLKQMFWRLGTPGTNDQNIWHRTYNEAVAGWGPWYRIVGTKV